MEKILTYTDVDRTSLRRCLVVSGYEFKTKREKQGQLGLPMFHFPFSHRLVLFVVMPSLLPSPPVVKGFFAYVSEVWFCS